MRHVISILIENEAGALSRVVGLFSQRGYNIDSLTVAPTEDPTLSRCTILTLGDEEEAEQITKQLHKLVDVLRVNDYEEDVSLERELVLIKLPTPNRNTRDEVRSLCEIFSAKIIDVTAEVYTVQYVGSAEEVDNFIATVGKCSEILETVRSGVLGIAKGNHFMHS
ncbi:acetolactate synthase small subunit [Succinatimonas hippei]|uniref:acetolactate synthase small subunit n=1 Tax=Succinatimonas hippei TaxID=626938 RepID=UPI0024938577|nr:acetolactate synthase small subunit [Succinatimonas hippei]